MKIVTGKEISTFSLFGSIFNNASSKVINMTLWSGPVPSEELFKSMSNFNTPYEPYRLKALLKTLGNELCANLEDADFSGHCRLKGSTIEWDAGRLTIPFNTLIPGHGLTWFCIARTGSNNRFSTTSAEANYLIGTVGLAGSGADLILPTLSSTDIANVKCNNMTFNIT